ncbi:MAG: type I restriction enzyme HsdR N-terminal domain-containing protein [Desulfobacterium sp.]|jgi:hypothetical protein|nr:type I restriction enzyme HsdR N-terminal domain-containing protein [Desulfobacterium sp.]
MEEIETLIDYVTGKEIPNIGPEESRQAFERLLVEKKGYDRGEIRVNEPICVTFKGEEYHSTIDLVVFCNDRPLMAVRCIAGSLGSYEREILAGARLVYDVQIPFSVATNGIDALVRDAVTGGEKGRGLDAVPSKKEALEMTLEYSAFPLEKKEREMIIFRSYNLDKNHDDCKG